MFSVRSEQMRAMRASRLPAVEARILQHLRQCFPGEIAHLSDADLRLHIRHGLDRGEAYGLQLERDFCRYVDLMLYFGRDFDIDPRLRFARPILTDSSLSPTARMDRLLARAYSRIAFVHPVRQPFAALPKAPERAKAARV